MASHRQRIHQKPLVFIVFLHIDSEIDQKNTVSLPFGEEWPRAGSDLPQAASPPNPSEALQPRDVGEKRLLRMQIGVHVHIHGHVHGHVHLHRYMYMYMYM